MATTPEDIDEAVRHAVPVPAASGSDPRSGVRRAAVPPRRAPLPIAAVVAAGWAAIVSSAVVLALVAIGLLGSDQSGLDVLRTGVAVWLLGHGVPLSTDAGRITLVPLAVTALCAWRLARAGVHAGRAAGAQHSSRVRPAVAAGFAV